jgi:hypothetical protein
MSEGKWLPMPSELLCSRSWHASSCRQWLEPISETCSLNEGTNCWTLYPTLKMSVCRQPGKPRVVIWTKCHCLENFLLMCFFCDDKSQAYARDNNTKCLTAFLTVVWHFVCLIIVSITHTSKLLWCLSEFSPPSSSWALLGSATGLLLMVEYCPSLQWERLS